MKRFITIILAIFELVFYTFFMVLIDDITITNVALKQVVHFSSLLIIAILLYFILKLLLKLLKYPAKESLYMVCVYNIIIGIFFPIILIILIPNETLEVFSFLLLVSAFYYGILINIAISIINSLSRKKQ